LLVKVEIFFFSFLFFSFPHDRKFDSWHIWPPHVPSVSDHFWRTRTDAPRRLGSPQSRGRGVAV
jgi:hypothetical protein